MDSVLPDDPTLPLDFDASVDISHLPDITNMGTPIRNTDRLSDPGPGPSYPAVFNVLSESPGSSVMKDFGTQISDLKKENFSLKLRIFYMEERINEHVEGDNHDQLWRNNIELKVECDNLKKDLQHKHDLLVKASNAVASMYTEPSDEKVREEAQQEVEQLREVMNEKVEAAERELHEVRREASTVSGKALQFQKQFTDMKDQNEELVKELDEAKSKIQDLTLNPIQDQGKFGDKQYRDLQKENIAVKLELEEAERFIEDLKKTLSSNKCVIELLNEEKENLLKSQVEPMFQESENFQVKLQDMEALLDEAKTREEATEKEYQEHITKQQEKLDDFQDAANQLTVELDKKQNEIDELKRDWVEKERGYQNDVEKKANENAELKEKEGKADKDINKRDRAIAGLTQLLRAKNEEVDKLKNQLSEVEEKIEKPSDNNNEILGQLNQKNEEIKNLKEELAEAQSKIEDQKSNSIYAQEPELIEMRQQVEQSNLALQVEIKEKFILRENYNKQIEDLKELVKENKQDALFLQQELRDAIKEVVDLDKKHESEINELNMQIKAQVKKKLDSQEKEAQTERDDMENKYENQIEELNQQVYEKDQQIELLKSQIFEHEETVSSLGGAVHSRNEEINELQKNNEDILKNLQELIDERDNLYADLESANNEIEELKAEQYNLEQQYKQQKEQIKAKDHDLQNLERSLKEELDDITRLNKELQTKLNAYKEGFKNPSNTDHQQEIESLQKKVKELNNELSEANHALKNMQRKVDFYSDSEFSSDCSSNYGISYSKSSRHKPLHKRYSKKYGPRPATSDASDSNFNQTNKFEKSIPNDTVNTTFLHLNQTSYMDIPTPNGYHDNHDNDYDHDDSFLNMNTHEMKQVLINTRNQLADTITEVNELRKECDAHVDNLKQMEKKITEKNQELKNLYETAHSEKMTQESEVLGLLARIKDNELTKNRNVVVENGIISDSEHSVISYRSMESDGMSSLHKSELQDVIVNLKQKLSNAEKVNDLLKKQSDNDMNEMQEKVEEMKTQMESLKLENEKLEKEKRSPSIPYLNSKIPLPKTSKIGDNVLRQELERARMLNGKLNKRIVATEETVRQQADRLNRCKIALREAGIVSPPMSPIRGARSVPNLASPTHNNSNNSIEEYNQGFPQRSQSAKKAPSLSPSSEQKFNSLIQSQAKELSNLREQLSLARECSKRLKRQSDIVINDVSSLLSSCDDFIDEKVIESVGEEIESCQNLVREIKNHLHETDSTSSQSEEEIEQKISSKNFKPNNDKLDRLKQELEEKNKIINNLEKKLETTQLDGSLQTPKKSHQTKQRHGLLTPTTSHHSIHSIYDDDVLDKLSSSVSMVDDKYKKLPPVSPRNLPTYQRTIAVTEYLPPVYMKDSPSKRFGDDARKLDKFSLHFGGAWSSPGQPKSISVNNSLYDHESSCDDETSHENHKLSREVDRLRRRLNDQKRINRTLKEELELAMSSLEKSKENFVPGYQRKLSNNTDNLMKHLSEIRGLRQRLERSIATNDKLREKLDAQLDSSRDNVSTNIYLPYDQNGSQNNSPNPKFEEKMKQTYSDAIAELKNLQKDLHEKSSQTDLMVSHINKLQQELHQQTNLSADLGKELCNCKNQLSEYKHKLDETESEKNNSAAEVKHLKDQSKRLYKDMENLKVQLTESYQLIDSLKSELKLHENIHHNPTDNYSEFLEEIRSLRVELERSIEVNAALRKNLQDQVDRNPQLTTINIHHLSPPDHQRISKSAPTTARRRLHLDTVAPPTRNHVFMTPPASGSSDGGKTFTFDSSIHKMNGDQSPPLHCTGGPYTMCKTSHFKRLRDNIYDSSLLVRSLDKQLQQTNVIEIGRKNKNGYQNLDISKLSSSLHRLRNLSDISEDTLKMFWPCNIPHHKDMDVQSFTSSGVHSSGSEMNSSFYKRMGDPNKEADGLRREVGKLRRKLNTQDRLLKSTVDRLHSTNKMKEGIEHSIVQQLTKTHEVLRKARGNLEANVTST